ncbi:MAG TPA: hypothetical protein VFG84_03535 [Gemmatimonadaceae bacterium]|nr:hypothetical protein [Gemmatimonadaceae bacterium]
MPNPKAMQQAFDELRFGARRTLNLRTGLPSAADAAHRAEQWVRAQQAAGAKEVLVITGRGRRSDDGIARIRDAVGVVLARLTRAAIVDSVQEHTAGSFAVALRPFGSMPARAPHDTDASPTVDPATLRGLGADSLVLLRRLAITSLDSLGVRSPDAALVNQEMENQFTALTRNVAPGTSLSEEALCIAIRAATIRIEDSF